nr:helix-turn-helix transcriptional regulator [Thermophilibacter mediterraneus]
MGGRQALGLSQEELAQRLYVSRVTVRKWETGRALPDVQSMLLIANLFGTTIDELVRGDVDEMREMVEKNERRTRTFAVALAAVAIAIAVVAALAGSFALGRLARPAWTAAILPTLSSRRPHSGDPLQDVAQARGVGLLLLESCARGRTSPLRGPRPPVPPPWGRRPQRRRPWCLPGRRPGPHRRASPPPRRLLGRPPPLRGPGPSRPAPRQRPGRTQEDRPSSSRAPPRAGLGP